MAPISFSPDASISSHTLSAGSAQPSPMDLRSTSPATAAFLAKPTAFLLPSAQLNSTFLTAAKQLLDPVATGVSEAQVQRQQEQRKKRKRGEDDGDDSCKVLQLKKIHIQGFSTAQVWQQASKILDAAVDEIERSLPQDDDDTLAVRAGEEDGEDDISELEDKEASSELGEEGVDWEYDGEDVSGEEGLDEEESADDGEDLDGDDYDMEDDEEGIFSDDGSGMDEPAETYRPDPNGLNDGFFEIDQFNKQTDFLEQSALLHLCIIPAFV